MELITDRTESDVLNRTRKGYYEYTDLNRVENAVAELIPLGKQMDIRLSLVVKTDWGLPGVFPVNFPTGSEMARYLGNVRAVRDAFGIVSPLPASMRLLTHTGANNIERVLYLAYQKAAQTIPNTVFCGEIFAGEE